MIVASGGIGGNARTGARQLAGAARRAAAPHGLRRARPCRRTDDPNRRAAGAGMINRDRMWHYIEGVHNWTRSGPRTASASCPGPRRCGSTPRGQRLPPPLFPGYDTLGTLGHLLEHRLRLFLVRHQPEHRAQGILAVRLRAEPRPDRAGLAPRRAPGAVAERDGAGGGVQEPGRRFHRQAEPARAGRRDERARRTATSSSSKRCRARSRRAIARSPIPSPRTRRSWAFTTRAAISATS